MNKTMLSEKFTALFKGYKIPKDLKNLYDFQTTDPVTSYYSNGLYLIDEDPGMAEEVCKNESFIKAFIPFAEADSAGSHYAFWTNHNGVKDLNEAPIVVFGEEGVVYAIAEQLKDLLRIAAYDVETVVDEEGVFYQDREILEEEGEYNATEFNKEYLEWLREEAKLKPVLIIDEVDEIVANAERKFGEELRVFCEKFNS